MLDVAVPAAWWRGDHHSRGLLREVQRQQQRGAGFTWQGLHRAGTRLGHIGWEEARDTKCRESGVVGDWCVVDLVQEPAVEPAVGVPREGCLPPTLIQ